MTNITALIPARSGSQRVKNKNLKEIQGHPLIAFTISAAIRSNIFDRIVVSTDSKEIAEVSKHYGAEAPNLRKIEFAGNSSPDIEWIKESAIDWLKLDDKDNFAILRPTSPLRKPQTIVQAYQLFLKNEEADSLRAIKRVREHPGKMWRKSENDRINPFIEGVNLITKTFNHSSPLQTLEPLWIQDASLEISKVKNISETNSISGNKVVGFEMPAYEGFDLNFIEDFFLLEKLIEVGEVELEQPVV